MTPMTNYNKAAQLDPTHAATYFFNEGAILTNAGKVDDAIAAFDKVIAADPTKAAAYYWKGVNLIGKATLKGDKMVAPEGTAEAFQKYLELEPEGKLAQPAKDMLASIGATVETGFGRRRSQSRSSRNSTQDPVSIGPSRRSGYWGLGYVLQLPRSMTYLSFALPRYPRYIHYIGSPRLCDGSPLWCQC